MTITAQPRTYQVVTYGCQMNNHDSERIAGLLEDAGYAPHAEGETSPFFRRRSATGIAAATAGCSRTRGA